MSKKFIEVKEIELDGNSLYNGFEYPSNGFFHVINQNRQLMYANKDRNIVVYICQFDEVELANGNEVGNELFLKTVALLTGNSIKLTE